MLDLPDRESITEGVNGSARVIGMGPPKWAGYAEKLLKAPDAKVDWLDGDSETAHTDLGLASSTRRLARLERDAVSESEQEGADLRFGELLAGDELN